MYRWTRPVVLGGLALLLLGGIVGFWAFRRDMSQQTNPAGPSLLGNILWDRPDDKLPDPRLAYRGPFKNIHPDVEYVGSKKCAECHEDIARSYAKHPMGRSIIPIAELAGAQVYDKSHRNPFESSGSLFSVDVRKEGVWHRVTRADDKGRPIVELAMEVQFAVGSGSRGHSYLTDRNGYVFQTPISWFAQKKIWDLAPGFAAESILGRPVVPVCLFCHADRTRPREGAVNCYETPALRGPAIGCERCHGPGGLHVAGAGPLEKGQVDPTIVNPRHLKPAEREAICQQCHLHGEARVRQRGRDLYDFRPGLPLESCWSIFVSAGGSADDKRAVSHVEQMHVSTCFQRSLEERKLDCISCHDPHQTVGPDRRVAFYRERCLRCHAGGASTGVGCSLSLPERRRQNKDDSCIACHMPRYASSDIAHNSATDHRILRRPDTAAAPPPPPGPVALLRPFQPGLAHQDSREAQRDLGIALGQVVQKGKGKLGHAHQAIDMLRTALEQNPHDWEAWESAAQALLVVGRTDDALEAVEALLSKAPQREHALVLAGGAAQKLGKTDLAKGYWRRAVAVNPWIASYRAGLVTILASEKAWDEAGPQCREWLKLEPGSVDGRIIWIEYLLHEGERRQAQAEFDRLKALNPPNRPALEAWFARLAPP